MESATPFYWVGFFGIVIAKAWELQRIGEISRCEAVAKKFGKGSAPVALTWVWEIVVDV